MAKLKNIIWWVLGLGSLFFMMGFGANKADQVRVEGLEVRIQNTENAFFVLEEEIKEIVHETYPYLDSLRLNEINIVLLEERLDNHPSIRKSEVYSNFIGQLYIEVIQKKPIARILHPNGSYYLTEQGDSMSLSNNYSAKVPLLTGNVNRETRAKAFEFFQKTKHDVFYRGFFSGIHIEKNGKWVLYPKSGQHHVLLGEHTDVEKKLKKLKTFYQTAVDESTLEALKSINLQFSNQVICQKH